MLILDQLLNPKKTAGIFVCQLSEDGLKVVKCCFGSLGRREFSGVEFVPLSAVIDDKILSDIVKKVFKRLGYDNEQIIICLNRNKSTCRYIKIPSIQQTEIERIVSLQAPRYIPYQQNELITGYQVISSSRDGYSYINLSIVHKDIIERFTRIVQGFKSPGITVALSSYGLVNMFSFLYPHDQSTVILVDLDERQAELAIVGSRKSLFSRSFRINKDDPAWQKHFLDEIKRTREAYLKEVSQAAPQKILIFGQSELARGLAQYLSKELNLPSEIAAYAEKLKFSPEAASKLSASPCSFVACVGLALEDLPESLNMLPPDLKVISRHRIQKKEVLRIGVLSVVIVLFFILGLSKNLSNKALYLKKLKTELNKINTESRPLEEIDKRFKILESRSSKKPSTMDIISSLFRAIPVNIQLVSINFEENGQIILRGQAQDLNSAFNLVPELEKSPVFAKFSVKVRYATKKITERGEIIDFEVICRKR
ncbi:MAG: pilus assembly protein PilM [Candidatus Omnitrophota bacterium]